MSHREGCSCMNNRGESVTRNRMSMSCRRGSSRPRCAHCFENTAFRQLNSLFPSSLRCGSRRSIVACFRSRASCTCLWTFAQRLGRQSTREQREQSRYKDSSLKSSLGPNRRQCRREFNGPPANFHFGGESNSVGAQGLYQTHGRADSLIIPLSILTAN